MKHTCPNCSHTWSTTATKATKAPSELAPPDLAALSDAELFAYRKRTGPQEDARFFLRSQGATLSAAHALTLAALIERNPPRVQFLRELYQVQVAHWRTVPYAPFTYEEARAAQYTQSHRAVVETPEDVGEPDYIPDEPEAPTRDPGDDDGHDYSDPGDAKAGYEDYYGID